MLKHWAVHHPDVSDPPKFRFSVVQMFKDPLSRMIGEALKIQEGGSMNSKSEFGTYKLKRISIENSDWEAEKQASIDEKQAKLEESKMQVLRAKTQKSFMRTNPSDFSRIPSVKRKGMSETPIKSILGENASLSLGENAPSPILKKSRVSETLQRCEIDTVRMPNGVKSKKGSWDPARRSFKKKHSSPVFSHGCRTLQLQ